MKRIIATLCLLAVPFATSCSSTSTYKHIVGSDDYEIARHTSPDGAEEIYQLRNGKAIRVTTEYERERPFLGFRTQELTKDRAARRGTKPYAGLLVTGSYADSSAKLGGVLPDDVLVSVAGKDVVYVEQLAAAEATLRAQQEVPIRVLRGDDEIELTLRANLLRETVRDIQDIRLEAPRPAPRPYAGVNLHGIPKVWAERMLGEGKNGVVVAEVEVGSPAWLAGIRGGDLIQTMDGQPVPPLEEMSAQVAALGEAGKSTTWGVRRELGRTFEATIELEDYSGTAGFVLPFIFNSSNTTYQDTWRLGMGLIMGNRNSYVSDQTTRTVKTKNRFSALLGLIRVNSDPEETRVRLLWFIHFDT
ncbi:MAG: hypothetical protein ACI91B_005059 [Planctomycetota bacterium]|jgi:hypothetical protein